MKTFTRPLVLLLVLLAAACGDDGGNVTPDSAPDPDSPGVDGPPAVTFRQIEHLGRPGVAEALLLTDGFLEGYNATAPSFTGVPQGTLGMVIGEAKTVLRALYLGGCLLNGFLGLNGAAGVKPANFTCVETTDMFVAGGLGGTTLKQTVIDQSNQYADRVFAQFESDVMRIDTAVNSSYLTLCNGIASVGADLPLLCGGRLLTDDVIDVTYSYFLNAAATTPGPKIDGVAGQVRALTTDGVVFDNSVIAAGTGANTLSLTDGVPANDRQGHPAVTNTFPYSGRPL